MRIVIHGPALAVKTCSRRLATLMGSVNGERISVVAGANWEELVLNTKLSPERPDLDCKILWQAADVEVSGCEGWVQAESGLAHLHGLEVGRPRRIGLDVATITAGVLASQGVLAALTADASDVPIVSVRTSVLHAALLLMSQYIARASCSEEWSEWAATGKGPEPGPPFETKDGLWFEMETLEPLAWKGFWRALGVEPSLVPHAWNLFRARYSTATCSMPAGFHQATRRRTMQEVVEVAHSFNISLCPLRSYEEVLATPGIAGSDLPTVTPWQAPARASAVHVRRDQSASFDSCLPLRGIRVVEATSRIQGPLAGQLLRMLGADVLRVEPPGGDPARMTPPMAGSNGALFSCMNRGKQPLELDLTSQSHREGLVDLIADADVFLHNWRPGKAEEWGLGADRLSANNPRLVYCAASGWGAKADGLPRIGMEFLVQAYAGLGNGINPEPERPFPTRLLLTDFMGGMLGCEGILGGLYLRKCDDVGCAVDSSLLAGAMALHRDVLEVMASGDESAGRRRGRPVWGPLDRPLETADGYLFLCLDDADARARLCLACGVDPELDEAESVLIQIIQSRSSKELRESLKKVAICCGTVRKDLRSLLTDVRTVRYLEPVDRAWMPTSPWEFAQ